MCAFADSIKAGVSATAALLFVRGLCDAIVVRVFGVLESFSLFGFCGTAFVNAVVGQDGLAFLPLKILWK